MKIIRKRMQTQAHGKNTGTIRKKHEEIHSENRGAGKTHEITNASRKQGMKWTKIDVHILKTA